MVSTKYLALRYLEDIRDDPEWYAAAMQKKLAGNVELIYIFQSVIEPEKLQLR